MSELIRFLLARITEDEAPASSSDAVPSDCWGPDRVLAECEAKRELIRIADPYDFADDGGGGMSEHADTILRTLAAVYADHPEYRDEWAS